MPPSNLQSSRRKRLELEQQRRNDLDPFKPLAQWLVHIRQSQTLRYDSNALEKLQTQMFAGEITAMDMQRQVRQIVQHRDTLHQQLHEKQVAALKIKRNGATANDYEMDGEVVKWSYLNCHMPRLDSNEEQSLDEGVLWECFAGKTGQVVEVIFRVPNAGTPLFYRYVLSFSSKQGSDFLVRAIQDRVSKNTNKHIADGPVDQTKRDGQALQVFTTETYPSGLEDLIRFDRQTVPGEPLIRTRWTYMSNIVYPTYQKTHYSHAVRLVGKWWRNQVARLEQTGKWTSSRTKENSEVERKRKKRKEKKKRQKLKAKQNKELANTGVDVNIPVTAALSQCDRPDVDRNLNTQTDSTQGSSTRVNSTLLSEGDGCNTITASTNTADKCCCDDHINRSFNLDKTSNRSLPHAAAGLETRADSTQIENTADSTQIESRADSTQIESRADSTEIENTVDSTEIETRADSRELYVEIYNSQEEKSTNHPSTPNNVEKFDSSPEHSSNDNSSTTDQRTPTPEDMNVSQDQSKYTSVKILDSSSPEYGVSTEKSDPLQNQEALSKLSQEIMEFSTSVQRLVAKNQASRQRVLQQIHMTLKNVFPCAQLALFGSTAYGVALPDTDLDVFYVHNEGMLCSREHISHRHMKSAGAPRCLLQLPIEAQLEALHRHLWSEPWCTRVLFLKRIPIPIVKFTACPSAMDFRQSDAEDTPGTSANHHCPQCCMVDLSCGDSPGHAKQVSVHYVRSKLEEFPMLTPLLTVLKQFLLEKGLSDTFTGGLGAFPLILLVVRFLQSRTNQVVEAPPVGSIAYRHFVSAMPNPHADPFRQASSGRATHTQVAGNGGAIYKHLLSAPVGQILQENQPLQQQHAPIGVPMYSNLLESDSGVGRETQRGIAQQQPTMTVSNGNLDRGDSSTTSEPNGNSQSESNLGELLLGFFDYFGNQFDPRTQGVSVVGHGALYPIVPNYTTPMQLDNPLLPGHNVAAGTFRIGQVCSAFREAHQILSESLSNFDVNQDKSVTVVLRNLLKIKWGKVSRELLRKRLTAPKDRDKSV